MFQLGFDFNKLGTPVTEPRSKYRIVMNLLDVLVCFFCFIINFTVI